MAIMHSIMFLSVNLSKHEPSIPSDSAVSASRRVFKTQNCSTTPDFINGIWRNFSTSSAPINARKPSKKAMRPKRMKVKHAHAQARTQSHTYTRTNPHTRARTHAYTHTHTHTHTHKHTQTFQVTLQYYL